MAKGTISIKNGATTINGDGTTFTSELVAGDYVVFTAGQVVYTQAVKTVSSDTALTLTRTYTGPDAAGLAWSAVPRGTMSQVTMEVVNQVTEALRGLNLDKANWQQVFSAGENITVTLPDGSQFKGPSWPSLVSLLEDLDPGSLQKIVEGIKQAQASVSADRQAAETASSGAKASADNAAAAKKAAEDAMAVASRGASNAAASASTAAQAVSTASQAATDARAQADRAQSLADKFDAEKVLTKDANLSDVTDRAASLKNLLDGKPLPLAAPAVNPNDAPTLQQVQNMAGGGTGPTQTGVMNFGIGSKRLHDNRNYIPSYEVFADGQLLSRADWPDLWAYAQMIGVIADSAWVSDVTQRSKYSGGDGSTTFRVPDLNGTQKNGVNGFTGPNSILGLYGRGDSGAGSAGAVQEGGVPNIAGAYNIRNLAGGGRNTWGHNGAFFYDQDPKGTQLANIAQAGDSSIPEIMRFDASRSSALYKPIAEVRPNSFINVWVIRASGAFVAANTSFAVMNSYAAGQPDQSLLEGGRVQSEVRVAGALAAKAALVVKSRVGGRVMAVMEVTDSRSSPSVTETLEFPAGSGTIMKWGDYGIGSPTGIVSSGSPSNANNSTYNGFYTGPGAGGVNFANEYMPMLVMSRAEGSNVSQVQVTASGSLSARARINGTWTAWRETWNASNTTVDANGFIKRASPVVKIFSDGSFETNDESYGATVSRIDEGVYLIEGCLGLNSDGAWSGPDGGFEIPVDRNKQPIIWLDYSVGDDGSITVKTYHRVNGSSPNFAQNIVEGKSDGDPIDIPSGVFVSVRVQMPEVE
ncbi:tail fiber protein [Cronobacter dublinensis]|nr:tail fiber protein [Cronobacter dublinensis]